MLRNLQSGMQRPEDRESCKERHLGVEGSNLKGSLGRGVPAGGRYA